jgi:transaldolase
MGASFRNLGEIRELAGCDLLTIAPNLLAQMKEIREPLPRKLDADQAKKKAVARIAMSKEDFDRMHAEDRMSKEKLAEGIQGFSKAMEVLEKLLTNRLAELEKKDRVCDFAWDAFAIYDLDGDGVITREEWAGTDAVFDALDTDGDGRITPHEMAAGLGGAHCALRR